MHAKYHKPIIPAEYLNNMLLGYKRRNGDIAALLKDCKLDQSQLDSPDSRFSAYDYFLLVTKVCNELNDELLGFTRKPIPRRAFMVFCEGLIAYQQPVDCMAYANRFYSLFTDEFRWYWRQDGAEYVLGLEVDHSLKEKTRFLVLALLMVPLRILSWLIGEEVSIKGATFTHADNGLHAQESYLFGNNRLYSKECNELRIDARYVDTRFLCTPAQLHALLEDTREMLLFKQTSEPFTRQTRRILAATCHEHWLGIDAVADKIGISTATLRRRLQREGNTFAAIRDKHKKRWAINLLRTHPDRNIEEIARQVGYKDASAFHKAFKAWTGQNPAEYRKDLL
jgi:AraC-like DNA-binding protein